ncbi:glycosyltransferase family 4 protein [Succinivibrio dextrinosolvens]|uniref:glycosyltransferase family 4 protein n=1 Tax=Succinivibrio dextrinosolvens TaxID=83771 RepID=UPI001924A59F|nr:glycosyltransferase family 4 protein [Succinivibrio dextrinosolvens]
MNILFIANQETVGGATRSLCEVTSALKKLKAEVSVCTTYSNELNSELKKNGTDNFVTGHTTAMMPLLSNSWKKYLKVPSLYYKHNKSISNALKFIEEKIKKKNFDIVHTNSSRDDFGCYIKKEFGIPHVMHIREFGQEDFNCTVFHPNYYNFLNEYTDQFIAISEAVKKSWIKKGISEEKIKVVYNGIDNTSIIRSNHDSSLTRIVMAGGICKPKGQREAVEAVCYLLECGENLSMDIIGWFEPSYFIELRQYIKSHGCRDRIHFLGEKKSVYDLLCNYDIGLMCSKSEAFGRVTAEYMFAGLGIIASNCGANPELIKDHKNGLLYQKGDSKDLASKILYLSRNKNELLRLSNEAYRSAGFNYTISRNAKDILKVYEEMLF